MTGFGSAVRSEGVVDFRVYCEESRGGIEPATGVFEISEADAERVIRYRAKYGHGGFQGRLGTLAAVLVARQKETSSSFGKAA